MAVFTYVALDRGGRRTAGKVLADSRALAMDAVTQQGLSPLALEQEDATTASLRSAETKPPKVPRKAVEAFTRELASLLAGGLSLSRALSLLKRETSHPGARQVWGRIHDDVVGGEPLADALAKWTASFPPVYVAMVRAGEAGGFLHVVLQQIADFGEREQDLKARVKAALVYPVVLALVAAGVLVFLLTYFIPRFSGIFDQFGADLPLLTRAVVAVSRGLLQYGPLAALVALVASVALRRALLSEQGATAAERWILRTPSLGTVVARFALVRFCRMLGTLLKAGVPLVASLRVAREAIGNRTLAQTVSRAIDEVQRGTPLSRALAGDPLMFPAGVIETVGVAEETARLDAELLRLAGAYESDLDRNLRVLVAMAEPLLLLVMAALIGTVVVSMLLPLFTLQDMIQ